MAKEKTSGIYFKVSEEDNNYFAGSWTVEVTVNLQPPLI